MYAIVSTGGKQYKVSEDDVIAVEKLAAAAGDKVEFDVLFISDGDKIITDADALAKAKVTAEVIEQFRGEKQVVFKFKKRKGYRRLRGHRQDLTRVRILEISPTGTATRKAAAKPAAEKSEKAAPKPKATTEAKTADKPAAKAAAKPAAKSSAAAAKSTTKAPAKKAASKPAASKAAKPAADETK